MESVCFSVIAMDSVVFLRSVINSGQLLDNRGLNLLVHICNWVLPIKYYLKLNLLGLLVFFDIFLQVTDTLMLIVIPLNKDFLNLINFLRFEHEW